MAVISPETRPQISTQDLMVFRSDPDRADYYILSGTTSLRDVKDPPPFKLGAQEWEIFSERKHYA